MVIDNNTIAIINLLLSFATITIITILNLNSNLKKQMAFVFDVENIDNKIEKSIYKTNVFIFNKNLPNTLNDNTNIEFENNSLLGESSMLSDVNKIEKNIESLQNDLENDYDNFDMWINLGEIIRRDSELSDK